MVSPPITCPTLWTFDCKEITACRAARDQNCINGLKGGWSSGRSRKFHDRPRRTSKIRDHICEQNQKLVLHPPDWHCVLGKLSFNVKRVVVHRVVPHIQKVNLRAASRPHSSKVQVDNFMGELTFSNHFINTFCDINPSSTHRH